MKTFHTRACSAPWGRAFGLGALIFLATGCGPVGSDPSAGASGTAAGMASGTAASGSDGAPGDAVTVALDARQSETVAGVRLPLGHVAGDPEETFSPAPGPLGQPAPPPALIAGGPQVTAAPGGGQP